MSADHRAKPCTTCEKPIVFLPTKRGNMMPIDAETVQPKDTVYEHGRHVSHFASCSNPEKYRKPR